ncbi:MAG: photosynthetic complex putative assembly protein PuhB [Pseudomonadota bacterium]
MRFHDEEDTPGEPEPGLPEALPAGETVRWRGSPKPLAFAARVFRFRWVAGWFALVIGARIVAVLAGDGGAVEAAGVASLGLAAAAASFAVLTLLGVAMARSTVYTVTDRRIVLRYGVAIRKYVNLPFAAIRNLALKSYADGSGDLVVAMNGGASPGFLRLWPHARPFKFANAEAALRSAPDAQAVAALIAEAVKAQRPDEISLQPGAPATPSATATPNGATLAPSAA